MIVYCKACGRYLVPPKQWIRAELESKELLTFCIKRIKGLQKVKLIDASFIWTEPHSKRIKVWSTHGSVSQSFRALPGLHVVLVPIQARNTEACKPFYALEQCGRGASYAFNLLCSSLGAAVQGHL